MSATAYPYFYVPGLHVNASLIRLVKLRFEHFDVIGDALVEELAVAGLSGEVHAVPALALAGDFEDVDLYLA